MHIPHRQLHSSYLLSAGLEGLDGAEYTMTGRLIGHDARQEKEVKAKGG